MLQVPLLHQGMRTAKLCDGILIQADRTGPCYVCDEAAMCRGPLRHDYSSNMQKGQSRQTSVGQPLVEHSSDVTQNCAGHGTMSVRGLPHGARLRGLRDGDL